MTRKLDAKHLEDIQSLREQYSELTAAIGNITIEQQFLQEKIATLEQEKAQQFTALRNVTQQENELIAEMRDRYGEGQINIQDGTFTPGTGLDA
jgi:SMC interacting uncharacterized protein involved in chromosome segregation